MTDQHPITPPPELVRQWLEDSAEDGAFGISHYIATQAARWGADQQLKLDAKWLDHNALNEAHLKIAPMGDALKEAMRPKPLSLKAQALAIVENLGICDHLSPENERIIREALESLSN